MSSDMIFPMSMLTRSDIITSDPNYSTLLFKLISYTENIEVLKRLYQTHLLELENLYGRLSQDAFKGKLNLSKVVLREVYSTNDLPLEKAAEPQQTYGTHVT